MLPTKDAAKAAFDHSTILKKVFVTSDCVPFLLETDARWHAKDHKLEDRAITEYTRDEVYDVITPEDQEGLIGKINSAASIVALHALLPVADSRDAVNAAAKAKADELHTVEETTLEEAKTYWWNHIL